MSEYDRGLSRGGEPGKVGVFGHEQSVAPGLVHSFGYPITGKVVGYSSPKPPARGCPDVKLGVRMRNVLMNDVAREPGQRLVLYAQIEVRRFCC